jgi:hypothetical protein
MRTWLDLIRLQWLTGPDARPAFYKMVLVAGGVWLAALTVYCARTGTLAACIWPLVSLAIVLVFGAHGLKGLAVWAASKAPPVVTGTTAATVSLDATALAQTILKRRDPVAGYEATP